MEVCFAIADTKSGLELFDIVVIFPVELDDDSSYCFITSRNSLYQHSSQCSFSVFMVENRSISFV